MNTVILAMNTDSVPNSRKLAVVSGSMVMHLLVQYGDNS